MKKRIKILWGIIAIMTFTYVIVNSRFEVENGNLENTTLSASKDIGEREVDELNREVEAYKKQLEEYKQKLLDSEEEMREVNEENLMLEYELKYLREDLIEKEIKVEYYMDMIKVLTNASSKVDILSVRAYDIITSEYYNKVISYTFVDSGKSLEEKVQAFCNHVSKEYFNEAPIKVSEIKNVDGKKVAYISLSESNHTENSNEPGWNNSYFQGSAGGGFTCDVLLSVLNQDINGEWIHGVKFTYEDGEANNQHVGELLHKIHYKNDEKEVGTIKDYIPKVNTTYKYSGGFENGGFKVYVEEVSKDKYQVTKNDTAIKNAQVYYFDDEVLKLIYHSGERYEDIEYINEEPNEDRILLKEPLLVGNSWTNTLWGGEQSTSIITSTDFGLYTDGRLIKTIEVTEYRNSCVVKNYYAKGIGLFKSVYDYGGTKIVDELIEVIQ